MESSLVNFLAHVNLLSFAFLFWHEKCPSILSFHWSYTNGGVWCYTYWLSPISSSFGSPISGKMKTGTKRQIFGQTSIEYNMIWAYTLGNNQTTEITNKQPVTAQYRLSAIRRIWDVHSANWNETLYNNIKTKFTTTQECSMFRSYQWSCICCDHNSMNNKYTNIHTKVPPPLLLQSLNSNYWTTCNKTR